MEHLLHARLAVASEDQAQSPAMRELLDEAVEEFEAALDIINDVDSAQARAFMMRHSVPMPAPVYAKAPKIAALITGEEETIATAR
jgi:hypothetical protein